MIAEKAIEDYRELGNKRDPLHLTGQSDPTKSYSGSDIVNEVKSQAGELGHKAVGATDSAIVSVGKGMNSLADTLKENLPTEGVICSAGESVAGSLKSGGDYLSENGAANIAKDVTDLIRKHPMPSLWIGVGTGILLGSALSRKS